MHRRAAALNHKDLWASKGMSLPADKLPHVLGSDGVGVLDNGPEVVVHSALGRPGWRGDETLEPAGLAVRRGRRHAGHAVPRAARQPPLGLYWWAPRESNPKPAD